MKEKKRPYRQKRKEKIGGGGMKTNNTVKSLERQINKHLPLSNGLAVQGGSKPVSDC